MERAEHVREKYDLRSGKLFAKSKAFANRTRRAVRGIKNERAAFYITTSKKSISRVPLGTPYHVSRKAFHITSAQPTYFIIKKQSLS